MLATKESLNAKPEIMAVTQKNDFSLEVSTRMTLDLLLRNQDNNAAKDLLFFLGCFPNGIYDDELVKMWNPKDKMRDLPSLISCNLVSRKDSKRSP